MIRVYDYKIAKQKKRWNYCEEVQKQASIKADELREKKAEILGTGFNEGVVSLPQSPTYSLT